MAVVLFDTVKYTSDGRPPLLKDRFCGIQGVLIAGFTVDVAVAQKVETHLNQVIDFLAFADMLIMTA